MVTIEICMGSACYTRGADQVITQVQQKIADHGWQDRVLLKGSFCMKFCEHDQGLGIRINGEPMLGCNLVTAADAVEAKVSELLAKEG